MKWTKMVTAAAVICIATGIGGGAPALALCTGTQAVSACSTTCTSNCYLTTDLSCGYAQGLTLANGSNLDMCGRSLHCTAALGCGAGVTMTGNNSQVSDSSQVASTIDAFWTPGVNCAGKTGSKVVGIKFDNIGTYSTVNCAKSEKNVFTTANGLPAVYTTGVGNSDEIDNNSFQGDKGIYVDGDSSKITIHHNLFADGSYGITIASPSHAFDVNDNVFFGAGDQFVDSSTYGTYARNYCDPTTTSCGTCQSGGKCTVPATPFTLP